MFGSPRHAEQQNFALGSIIGEPQGLTTSERPSTAAIVDHLTEVVINAERNLPKKHLIAAQVEGPVGGPLDLSGKPNVSVIVTQYVWQAGFQMGGMRALDLEYGHNKPIEFNETAWYPVWYKGDAVADSRVEAWEFMYRFDFLKMSLDQSFVVSGIPSGVFCRGISESGKQYALYHHHSGYQQPGSQSSYVVAPGRYVEHLVLNLPGGTYKADWVDPSSGSLLGSEKFTHQGGVPVFHTPEHAVDVALRIKRV